MEKQRPLKQENYRGMGNQRGRDKGSKFNAHVKRNSVLSTKVHEGGLSFWGQKKNLTKRQREGRRAKTVNNHLGKKEEQTVKRFKGVAQGRRAGVGQ